MLNSFNSHLEKLDGYETDYVKILYYDLPKNFSDIYRTHSYARFCTILDGEKSIQVNNKSFSYSTTESLLLPAHSKVEMTIEKPTQALVFELSDELINSVVKKTSKEIPRKTNTKLQEVLVNNLHSNIREDVTLLMDKSKNKREQDPFLIDLYAQKLIYDLLEFDQASSVIMHQCQTPMDQAKQWIHSHIHETFSVKDVAAILNMSESNFSHAFKKHFNITPQKYIHLCKLEASLKLLKATSVTDVAFSLGYENPSYFIHLFKRKYGITPKQYQMKHHT